eukprot:10146837-Prorocentrum_lima.AAC.1
MAPGNGLLQTALLFMHTAWRAVVPATVEHPAQPSDGHILNELAFDAGSSSNVPAGRSPRKRP